MRLVDDPDAALWLDRIRGDAMFRSPMFFAGRIIQPAHDEPRWLVLGETEHRRRLALILTRRDARLRAVSCRPMRRKERKLYEEATREKGQVGNA